MKTPWPRVHKENHAKKMTYYLLFSDDVGLRSPVTQKKKIAKKRYTSTVAWVGADSTAQPPQNQRFSLTTVSSSWLLDTRKEG